MVPSTLDPRSTYQNAAHNSLVSPEVSLLRIVSDLLLITISVHQDQTLCPVVYSPYLWHSWYLYPSARTVIRPKSLRRKQYPYPPRLRRTRYVPRGLPSVVLAARIRLFSCGDIDSALRQTLRHQAKPSIACLAFTLVTSEVLHTQGLSRPTSRIRS